MLQSRLLFKDLSAAVITSNDIATFWCLKFSGCDILPPLELRRLLLLAEVVISIFERVLQIKHARELLVREESTVDQVLLGFILVLLLGDFDFFFFLVVSEAVAQFSVKVVFVLAFDFVDAVDVLFGHADLLVVLQDHLLEVLILFLPLILHLLRYVDDLGDLDVDRPFHHEVKLAASLAVVEEHLTWVVLLEED